MVKQCTVHAAVISVSCSDLPLVKCGLQNVLYWLVKKAMFICHKVFWGWASFLQRLCGRRTKRFVKWETVINGSSCKSVQDQIAPRVQISEKTLQPRTSRNLMKRVPIKKFVSSLLVDCPLLGENGGNVCLNWTCRVFGGLLWASVPPTVSLQRRGGSLWPPDWPVPVWLCCWVDRPRLSDRCPCYWPPHVLPVAPPRPWLVYRASVYPVMYFLWIMTTCAFFFAVLYVP